MKMMKKILALSTATTMVFGMAMTTWAAPSTETATVTVKNVTEGATVTAYQLVYYDDETQNYVAVDDAENLGYEVGMSDASVVSDIAEAVTAGDVTLASTGLNDADGDGDYTGSLTAGTYLILVTNSGDTIYNPMLVSL